MGTMSEIDPDPAVLAATRQTVARRLREIRRERGHSIKRLAAAAGLSAGMVSQIETEAVSPSIATLVKLATTLGIRVGELFGESEPRGRIIRKDGRRSIVYPSGGIRDEIISADPAGRIQVLHCVIDAGQDGGSEILHGADVEFVVVLAGRIELRLGEETVLLAEGDSITFSGDTPHAVRNPGSKETRMIWVVSPSTY